MRPTELLQKQTTLQRQAQTVLNRLDLIAKLSRFGTVKIVGSVALGLMTWPDIDIDLESTNINDCDYLHIVQYLLKQKNIKRLILIDNRIHLEKNRPKSMYLGIIYLLNGVEWKIDIRYLKPSAAWAEDDLHRIGSKLTPEKIQTILKIKAAFHSHQAYRKTFSSYDIYTAVLDKNISSIKKFSAYLKAKGVKS